MKRITVWAGEDIFAIEEVAEMDDPQAVYQQVSEMMLPRITEDFGSGAELKMIDARTFSINVDRVPIA